MNSTELWKLTVESWYSDQVGHGIDHATGLEYCIIADNSADLDLQPGDSITGKAIIIENEPCCYILWKERD